MICMNAISWATYVSGHCQLPTCAILSLMTFFLNACQVLSFHHIRRSLYLNISELASAQYLRYFILTRIKLPLDTLHVLSLNTCQV